MTRAAPIRILLVDDHLLVRLGLVGLLERLNGCRVVAEAARGAEAIEKYETHRPDVTLLDRWLPDMQGEEVARRLRERDPAARILMLSIDEGEEDIHRALEAGASGYLPKSVDGSELLEAIEAVHAGTIYVAKSLRAALERRRQRQELTRRELEVLALLVSGRTNKEIAGELGLSEVTIKVHVGRLLQKLGASDRTQAATVAIARGIVHVD